MYFINIIINKGPSIISCSQGFAINQFYKLEKIISENSNRNATKSSCSGCSLIVPQQTTSPIEKSEEQDDSSQAEFEQGQLHINTKFEQIRVSSQNDSQSDMIIDEEEDHPLEINIKNKSIVRNNNRKMNEIDEMHKANNRASSNKLNTNNNSSNENEVGFKGFISDDIENNMTYITTRYPYLSRLYPIVRQACVRRYF